MIDILSAGYTAVNRRGWVLLFPIILDLYLWFGARLSFAPIMGAIRNEIAFLADFVTRSPQQREALVITIINADMRQFLAWFNLVPLLGPDTLRMLPAGQAVLTLNDPLSIVFSVALINVVALILSSIFFTLLARSVTGRFGHTAYPRYLWHALQGIAGYLIILFGFLLGIGLPFAMLLALVSQALPALTAYVLVFGFLIGFWIMVYTGFAVEAVLISEVNTLQAILYSIRLVQRNFWSAMGLLMLTILITTGLSFLWADLIQGFWGVLVAVLGSAYISSGLVAARMVFYQQRWKEITQSTKTKRR
ncbi:MAG: hypothetical protein HC914_16690 [Chloroflexaceae bacterium]|nr:hypothetical protein [Chloroflexaceae bacterium]